jgi:hypothetical protein
MWAAPPTNSHYWFEPVRRLYAEILCIKNDEDRQDILNEFHDIRCCGQLRRPIQKMKYTFLLLVLIINAMATQAQMVFSGTLIVVIPMWDGIIIAADSRISLKTTENNNPIYLGYFDEFQKLFQLKQFVLGVSGRNEFEGVTMHKIVNDFNKISDTFSSSPHEVLESFNLYLLEHYEEVYGRDSLGNKFICCGYVNGTGSIAYLESKTVTDKPLEILASEQVSISLIKKVQKQSAEIATEHDIIKLAEDIIDTYAKETNQVYKIGGRVSVFKITNNNKIEILQNDFGSASFDHYKEIITAYFSGRLNITFLKPEYKEIVDRIFERQLASYR